MMYVVPDAISDVQAARAACCPVIAHVTAFDGAAMALRRLLRAMTSQPPTPSLHLALDVQQGTDWRQATTAHSLSDAIGCAVACVYPVLMPATLLKLQASVISVMVTGGGSGWVC